MLYWPHPDEGETYMREVEKQFIKPETEDVLIHHMNQATSAVQRPRFYGKFRAYLFCNFGVIAIVCLALTLMFLFSDDPGHLETAAGMAVITLFPALITWLIWKSVAKKVKPEERRLVFFGFFATGILVFGKLLLILTIILIPLAMRITGDTFYEYRYVSSGTHAGSYVLMRCKLNGQYEDIYGNVYES